jgi:HK97 family phage major capsid protein
MSEKNLRDMSEKELIEKKNDLITRAEEVLNKAKEEKRELTEAEMEELSEARDNTKKITKKLEETNLREFFNKSDQKPKQEIVTEGLGNMRAVTPEQEAKEIRAFDNFIRGKVRHERDGELTFNDNGAIVPTTIANRIIGKVYDMCPILEKSDKHSIKGKFQLPYYDTSTKHITVGFVDEFDPLTSSSGEYKTVELSGFLTGVLTKVSRSLINNSQFKVVDHVVNHMSLEISRFIENNLLNGTVDKVDGLSKLENKVTAAAENAIKPDELLQLQDKVKDVFQRDAFWIMHPETRAAVRSFKDSVGRYLLTEDYGIGGAFRSRLFGRPIYVSENMPKMEAGKAAVIYGDMSGLSTNFTEQISIEILKEVFANEHAYGVIGYCEFDAKVTDPQKIAKLVMKA